MRYRVRFKWFVFLITRPACITTATYYLNLKSLLTLSGFRQPVFHRPIKNECQSIIARHNARFFYAAVTCNPSASKMHSKKKKISNWYLFLIKKISVWECHVIDNRYIMIQSQVDIMLYWFENWYLNIHRSRWMCVVEKYLWKKKKSWTRRQFMKEK